MINLHANAEVYCSDGNAGSVTYVVSNPVNRQITHLVVQSDLPPHYEYLVPVELVYVTTPHLIMLKCTQDGLRQMMLFQYEEYLPTDVPSHLSWPHCIPVPGAVLEEANYIPVEHQNIPTGESVVRRGARVEATDGTIGLVEELLMNANNMQVSHLVLQEQRILQKREITIPVSLIDRIDEDTIYLKVDRQSVEALPTMPIPRCQL
jgi:sporulation protein YlmC with PRC-barrel domain